MKILRKTKPFTPSSQTKEIFLEKYLNVPLKYEDDRYLARTYFSRNFLVKARSHFGTTTSQQSQQPAIVRLLRFLDSMNCPDYAPQKVLQWEVVTKVVDIEQLKGSKVQTILEAVIFLIIDFF